MIIERKVSPVWTEAVMAGDGRQDIRVNSIGAEGI